MVRDDVTPSPIGHVAQSPDSLYPKVYIPTGRVSLGTKRVTNKTR
jgi:hypothetical protein